MVDAELGGSCACAKCGAENPVGARICRECAAELTPRIRCASCGADVDAGQRFCGSCGAAVTASSIAEAQASDERKQVTVVFADVRGSMALAEKIGAEQLREVMNELFTRLAEAVTANEGTVDKFTGDGIMALFGAPVALEDHAFRACLAAQKMRDAAIDYADELERSEGIALELRFGLNSGEVIAGAIGAAGVSEYTAVGHTVGIAQRVESLASPGEIWLSESTARLVGPSATLESTAEYRVPGLSQTIKPQRLIELREERASSGSANGKRAKMIGRGREFNDLKMAADAAAAGNGSMLGIVGSPGVGKSRLAQTLVDYCDGRGLAVHRVNCQAHTREVARYSLLRLLRAVLGIENEESMEVARSSVSDQLLARDPAFESALPLIFDFLGMPDPERPVPLMDASARHRRLLALVDELANARKEPVVYVVEDLHWCDPESEVFFNAMADSANGTPTLFVGTMRPEFDGELLRRDKFLLLQLDPLRDSEIRQLVGEMVGTTGSMEDVASLIAGRCAGIPLFAEEIVYDLVESGSLRGSAGEYELSHEIEGIAAPSTVQAVLAARIDRLDPLTKSVLTNASTVGDEFRYDVLERISDGSRAMLDAALAELVENEFLVETAAFPVAAYKFRHPLTQEVAYGSQLADRRAGIHRKIAEALQEIYADNLNEIAALVASHLEAAGDSLPAAHWVARDAARATLDDPGSAFAGWQRVSRLSKASIDAGGGGEDIYLGALTMLLAQAYRFGRGEVDMKPIYTEARGLAEKNGDPTMLARLISVYGLWLGMVEGRVADWWRIGSEARKLTAEIDAPLVRLGTLTSATYCAYVNGKYEETIAITDELLLLTKDDPQLGAAVIGVTPASWALMIRAPALTELGRCEEARAAVVEAVEIAERFGGTTVAWSLLFKVLCALRGSEVVTHMTVAEADRSVEVAEEIGDVFTLPATLACRVGVLTQIGAIDLALEDADRALTVIRETGSGVQTLPTLNHFRMQALAARGDWDAAIASGEESVASSLKLGSLYLVASTQCGLAEIRIERNDFADFQKADRLLRDASKMVARLGSRMDEIEIHRVRCKYYAARDELEASGREYAAAVALARELGATGQLARLGAPVEAV
jgi:class 3 adenylate cyclase/tetratricopeptide (TPR) repeat protein